MSIKDRNGVGNNRVGKEKSNDNRRKSNRRKGGGNLTAQCKGGERNERIDKKNKICKIIVWDINYIKNGR
jgi:hypothetical protein